MMDSQILNLESICTNYLTYHHSLKVEKYQKMFAKEAYSTGWHTSPSGASTARQWTKVLWAIVDRYAL